MKKKRLSNPTTPPRPSLFAAMEPVDAIGDSTMEPFFKRDVAVKIEHSSGVVLEYDVETDPWANENVRFLFTNESLFMNRCIHCGIDMGPHNPRQLCGKWDCEEEYEPPILGDQAALLVGRLKQHSVAEGCARIVDISFRPDIKSGLDRKAPPMLFLRCRQGESYITTTDVDVCATTALVINRICGNYPVSVELILLYVSERWEPKFKNYYFQGPFYARRGNLTLLGPPRMLDVVPSNHAEIKLPSGTWKTTTRMQEGTRAIMAVVEPGADSSRCSSCGVHINDPFEYYCDKCAFTHKNYVEQQVELEKTFDSFDANDNGTISIRQLETAVRSLGLTPSESELVYVIRRFVYGSTDCIDWKSVTVDFSEFSDIVAQLASEDSSDKCPVFNSCALLDLRFEPFDQDLQVAVSGSTYRRDTSFGSGELPVRLFLDEEARMFHYPSLYYHVLRRRFSDHIPLSGGTKRARASLMRALSAQLRILSFLEPEPWGLSFARRTYWTAAGDDEKVNIGRTFLLDFLAGPRPEAKSCGKK